MFEPTNICRICEENEAVYGASKKTGRLQYCKECYNDMMKDTRNYDNQKQR